MSEDSCYESESTESKSSIWSDQRLNCTGAKPKTKVKYTDLEIDRQINASNACEKLQKKFRVIGWPGYKNKELVIVMFSTKSISDFPDVFETFRVILITDNENTMSKREAPRLLANDVKYCRPIIRRYGKDLMKNHSNISMIIPTAYRIKQGKILAHVCIAIYCRGKGVIPLQESSFPTTLGGVDIDVREGYCMFGMRNAELLNSNVYHEKLRIGVEIGWPGGPQGTLGGFIKLETGEILFLTCAHVVIPYHCLTSTENYRFSTHSMCPTCRNINVWQPPHITFKPAMGKVYDAVFKYNQPDTSSVDAAIVVITDRKRIPTDPFMTKQPSTTSQLRGAGFTEDNPPHFSSGEIIPQMDEPLIGHMVVKCGAVTGLTHGVLALDGGIFRMENQEMRMPGIQAQHSQRIVMYRQYLVESVENYPFFQMGDSGSLVFMHHGRDLKCIGMAIGNTSYGGCIVTPIEAILEAFQNDHHFGDPPFYPFDSTSDDDDFDDGGGDDNDGDDENDGFDHYQNRRQKQNRDNYRSNEFFQSASMHHYALNTRKDYEGPRIERLRKRGSRTTQFSRSFSVKSDSGDEFRLPSTSKRKIYNRQRADPLLTLQSYLLSDSESYNTEKGLHRRSQTKSSTDIPNESDGNTGCENDFDIFLSNEEINKMMSDIDGISNMDQKELEMKDKKEKNPRSIPNRAEILNRVARLQPKVQYRSPTTTLNVVGNEYVVVSSDVTIFPKGEFKIITSKLLERNEEVLQKVLHKTKQNVFTLRIKGLQILISLIFSFLKLSLGSEQGTLATIYSEALNTFAKTEKDT